MSTLQLLTEELSHQPEERVREVWHYLKFLEMQHAAESSPFPAPTSPSPLPDFEGRLHALYGGSMGADSQATMDFIRGDRC